MDQLEIMLKKIAPIIMNCQKKTAIPSWELDDYMQEGMIIALEMYHQILLNPPNTPFNFYVYFKVKFSCYLIDQHRKATAFKRKFDQLDYYELSETINLFDQRQNVSENVMYDLLCQEIHLFLTPELLKENLIFFSEHQRQNEKTSCMICYVRKYIFF
jgi:competence protein ComX